MYSALEGFRKDANQSYYGILNQYSATIRRNPSKLDKEREIGFSLETLGARLQRIKTDQLANCRNLVAYYEISAKIDVEIRKYQGQFIERIEL